MSENDAGLFVHEEMDFQRTPVHRFFLPVPLDVTWAGEIVYLYAAILCTVYACLLHDSAAVKFTVF